MTALTCSFIIMSGCSEQTVEPVADIDEQVQKVKVEQVTKMKTGNALQVDASLLPSKESTILTEINGTISNTFSKVGSTVEEGETLLQITNDDVAINYDRQQSLHSQAKLQVNKSKADRTTAIAIAEQTKREREISLENAKQNVAKLDIQLQSLDRNYQSMKKLFEAGAVAEEDYKKMKEKYESTKIDLEQANSQIEKAEIALDIATKQLAQAKNEYDLLLLEEKVDESALALKSAKVQLDKTEITAPISGVVVNMHLNVGEKVTPGQFLTKIEDHDPLFVSAFVTEHDYIQLKDKEELEVFIPVLQKKAIAKIDYLSPSKNPQEQGFPINLILENSDSLLTPGMSAHLILSNKNVKDVVVVPVSSVIKEEESLFVFVVKDNKVKKTEVKVGRKTEDHIEIIEGLNEGESIVIVGQGLIEDGDIVEVIK